jgi:serine phosphatase RsbU (regulator of sigma subunit)
MPRLLIRVPGQSPFLVEDGVSAVSIGRSTQNDLVISDSSLSRHHAKLRFEGQRILLDDLGSRNGTFLRERRVGEGQVVSIGDEVVLGEIRMKLEAPQNPEVRSRPVASPNQTSVLIEKYDGDPLASTALVVPVERLRSSPSVPAHNAGPLLEAIQELSLALVRDVSAERLMEELMERLFRFMRPRRGAIMLKNPQGDMRQVVVRSDARGEDQIRIAHTLVESVLERREALLLKDPRLDEKLISASFVLSGATSVILTPFEHEGEVVGLLYLDAGLNRPPFEESDLRAATTLAHLAAAKLQQVRLREGVQRSKIMERELELARTIQQRLLPGFAPELEGYRIFGLNVPSRQVSGDLFGHWTRPDGHMLLAIADVSGKGLGPGILMASMQTYLDAWSDRDFEPSDLAFRLSKALSQHTDSKRFVTAFLALLDPKSGVVKFTNAGHNPGLWLRDGSVESLGGHGLPLAMLPGQPYGQGELQMAHGDLLCLYTDGITEAADLVGNEFEMEALQALLEEHRNGPPEEIAARLMEALDKHTQGLPAADDRTLLMIKRL